MRQGIHLSTAADLHEHIAVIDRNIVWYGSANILSKDREQDSLIRICDSKTANNLYTYLHDTLAPSRTAEQPLLPLEG